MDISKKTRDTAMRIILDFHKNKQPGHSIGPAYLAHNGLPKNVDPVQVVNLLRAMQLITYTVERDGRIYDIAPTDNGISYFEREADEKEKIRKEFMHDWKIALFSAIAGAFLSEPLWLFLKWAYSLFSRQP